MARFTTNVSKFTKEHNITAEKLDDLHNAKGMTYKQIADVFQCSSTSIFNLFAAFNIPHRKSGWGKGTRHHTEEAKKKIGDKHRGKVVTKETREKQSISKKEWYAKGNHSSKWNGGKRTGRTDGYIQVYFPQHPNCTKEGYVFEHRLVMEQAIGRYLRPEEVVHHINGIRTDNRIENLHLFASNGEHQRYHALYTRKRNKGGFIS